MLSDKSKYKKIFIEQTLGTRKYFSYRTDLILYKLVLTFFTFIAFYMMTFDIIFSILISVQVFTIFTLINKLNMDRKEKEGKEQLMKNAGKEYFIDKLNQLSIEEFESFIKYYFKDRGFSKCENIGEHIYSAEKDEDREYIKIYKMYKGAKLEEIDIRDFLSFLSDKKIKKGYIVTFNKLSDDVLKFLDELKSDFNIEIINSDKLYDFAEKSKLLPEKKFFYKKLYDKKYLKSNKISIKYNTFNNKKTIIYVFASAFFFIIYKIMPNNIISKYIAIYFVILTIISFVYCLLNIYKSKINGKIVE